MAYWLEAQLLSQQYGYKSRVAMLQVSHEIDQAQDMSFMQYCCSTSLVDHIGCA